jgi:hypothetical protein
VFCSTLKSLPVSPDSNRAGPRWAVCHRTLRLAHGRFAPGDHVAEIMRNWLEHDLVALALLFIGPAVVEPLAFVI